MRYQHIKKKEVEEKAQQRGCPLTPRLCNQNKASPPHFSLELRSSVIHLIVYTGSFCVNVEFPVFACLR